MPLPILFVEDNANTARAMKVMLELKGYRVDVAGSVSEAVQALGANEYSVLLSDITLPDGTGFDILQQNMRGVPAIALSGHTAESARAEALSKGFAHYVTKPFNLNDLLSAIESATHQ